MRAARQEPGGDLPAAPEKMTFMPAHTDPFRAVRNESGVTLLEVLIAAVLLIVVMFWLTQYYVQGRKHLDYEEHRRKATAVAQARLDQVREWSYDYVVSLVDTVSVDTTMVVDGRSYDVRLYFSDGPNPHSTVVSAVVEWQAALAYEPGNMFVRRDTTTTVVGRGLGS